MSKFLHVGWMHRPCQNVPYSQIKKPCGGIKMIELNTQHPYSVPEVIKLAKETFEKSENSQSASINLNDCAIKFGGFKVEEVITEFVNDNSQFIGIWKYCQLKKKTFCRWNTYIFTTPKSEMKCPLKSSDNICKNLESLKSDKISGANNDETLSLKCEKRPKTPEVDTALLKKPKLDHDVIDCNFVLPSRDKDIALVKKPRLNEDVTDYNSSLPSSDKSAELLETPMLNDDVEHSELPSRDKDNIEIKFCHYKFSRYSQKSIYCFLDKGDIFEKVKYEFQGDVLEFNDFDPTAFGYPLCQMYIDGNPLLEIEVNNQTFDLEKFNFFKSEPPFSKIDVEDKHVIVHDTDVIQGVYCGMSGVGFIPSCTKRCKPIFTWFKDDKEYESGPFLYWQKDAHQISEEYHIWYCTVVCDKNPNPLVSKTILIYKSDAEKLTTSGLEFKRALQSFDMNGNDSSPKAIQEQHCLSTSPKKSREDEVHENQAANNLSQDVSNNLLIDRNNLIVTDILLGAGTQGKVFKGSYAKNTVAIKRIKISSDRLKNLAKREIELLSDVSHPNIIRIMGVCIEKKEVLIVTEFFEGKTLSDVLSSSEMMKDFNFTEKSKNIVATQICRAIAYLHLKQNPVLHRDIKTENIIINKQGIVKVCDLGVGKVVIPTSLKTTIAGSIPGSMLYMAPEILLNKESASFSSDVWSLGCTLYELYSEKIIWDVEGEDDPEAALLSKLSSQEKPDISDVPLFIRGIVSDCLSFDRKSRPHIAKILAAYESNIWVSKVD